MSIDGLKRLIKGVLSRWLPWSVRRLIYRKLAIRYIRSLPVALDRTRKTIIVLNHFFDQDVRALALANKRFNLVPIDTVTLFRGAKIFFDEDVRELEVRYAGADPARVARYRDEYQRIFDLLNEKLTVDLVVTASDVFYWVREFIAAARHRGVKTVVLDKEGTLSP